MKKFSKIAAVVALMLVVCLSFTGCGNLGNAIISALSLDVTVDDPALIKVEDILDKTVKTESVKSGDFTYTLYTDNTACITGYTGSNPVVSIPAEIDGAKVVGSREQGSQEQQHAQGAHTPRLCRGNRQLCRDVLRQS